MHDIDVKADEVEVAAGQPCALEPEQSASCP